MSSKINVIDLFAGPGGLGEGFTGFRPGRSKESPFKIRMSVEKEASAHKTLTLRALYRNLNTKAERDVYHDYIAGFIPLEKLKVMLREQWEQAQGETLQSPTALGEDNTKIHKQLTALVKKRKGEPWVVIGGPPCQAYSLAGRSRNKGIKGYRAENDNRHYLYKEYLEVLNIVQPDVFVMENVKGILTSKVNGERIFPSILKDLRNPTKALRASGAKSAKEYRIFSFVKKPDNIDLWEGELYENQNDYIIKSELYGVPQARHRVILLGVSTNIDQQPSALNTTDPVKIEHVLTGLPPLRSRLSRQEDSPARWAQEIRKQANAIKIDLEKKGENGLALDILNAAAKLKTKAGYMSEKYQGSGPIVGKRVPEKLRKWLQEDPPKALLNHHTRGHIPGDLGRYLFASCWANAKKSGKSSSPKAGDFPESLTPKHANWKSGNFADRFRVQVKGRPATTITSHISKDGHYFIHYDPTQCRSLTVREAARIQTFPDNYFFEGNRTEQYVQVGNAVPPFLARQLAEIVWKLLA